MVVHGVGCAECCWASFKWAPCGLVPTFITQTTLRIHTRTLQKGICVSGSTYTGCTGRKECVLCSCAACCEPGSAAHNRHQHLRPTNSDTHGIIMYDMNLMQCAMAPEKARVCCPALDLDLTVPRLFGPIRQLLQNELHLEHQYCLTSIKIPKNEYASNYLFRYSSHDTCQQGEQASSRCPQPCPSQGCCKLSSSGS